MTEKKPTIAGQIAAARAPHRKPKLESAKDTEPFWKEAVRKKAMRRKKR